MSVNLVKGQKINLTKRSAGLNKLIVGLGWDINKYDGDSFDLDASAFLLGENGKLGNDNDFVFYGNKRHESGAVISMGDNLTGEGEGDDEQIEIELSKVPERVQEIIFPVTIYDAEKKLQNFGMIDEAFIRIVNKKNSKELARFDLSEDYSTETGMIMGKLCRHNGEWEFTAVGIGFSGGLDALYKKYSS